MQTVTKIPTPLVMLRANEAMPKPECFGSTLAPLRLLLANAASFVPHDRSSSRHAAKMDPAALQERAHLAHAPPDPLLARQRGGP